jgi:hypothetical protein
MRMSRPISLLVALLALELSAAEKWGLGEKMGLPEWVSLDGQYRARYETLDGQFRTGRTGGDQLFSSRLSLKARVGGEAFGVLGEMLDSRQALADAGTPLNAGHVNALELLQGYAELNHAGKRWRFGRQTMDLGGRRSVARNRFRNTINSFNGLEFSRTTDSGGRLRAFYGLPVVRLPGDAGSLLANESRLDRESFDLQFASLFIGMPKLPMNSSGEVYLFGLYEEDSPQRASRNRRLLTPGLRWFRAPGVGVFDFELEGAFQFGRSRATTASADTIDLDHLAHMEHVAAGYTFDAPWKPRVVGQFDYVSGDGNPADGDNGRFDGLFGGNRFEHGPTGIFGEFGRVNMVSPGWRLVLKPARGWNVMFAHRGYWLASSSDGQGRSGLVDPGGGSGSYVGQQVEARLRWDVLPGNWRLETGFAHVFNGDYVRRAPGGTGQGETSYGYLQTMFWF